ncbi:GNAT family N-acetyltransferase [Clostridium sp. Marseille-P299]|uniref:GNAT family N-acetyltransferase n=1 Tax=Clostridium sp. Marseille-P299 TaxID=1805477 RepID=UPI0008375529|nr:GNAT family N-acetyltransferase [Clostridium sp. Marseille-P299]
MSFDIKFSQADYNDVIEISEIIKEAIKLMPNASWFCADDAEFIKRHISKEGIVVKAVQGEKIAGYLMVRFPKEAKDNLGNYLDLNQMQLMKVAHMESTAVLPEFQGMHIQRSLIEWAESYLQNNYNYFMATVHPDNIYSLNNFLSLGYEIVVTTKKYGGLPRHVLCKKQQQK